MKSVTTGGRPRAIISTVVLDREDCYDAERDLLAIAIVVNIFSIAHHYSEPSCSGLLPSSPIIGRQTTPTHPQPSLLRAVLPHIPSTQDSLHLVSRHRPYYRGARRASVREGGTVGERERPCVYLSTVTATASETYFEKSTLDMLYAICTGQAGPARISGCPARPLAWSRCRKPYA